MSTINLLPWRELKREHEKKQFTVYLAMALGAAAVVVFLFNSYATHLVDSQTHRNQQLENEIAKLDKQIKQIADLKKVRQALIARMGIVQDLQATRILTVRLFDELIKIIPDGLYLTKLERSGNKITLYGYAESNSNISQLMRKIQSDQWVQDPELTEIKKTTETKEITPQNQNEFKLSFILSPKTNGAYNEQPKS